LVQTLGEGSKPWHREPKSAQGSALYAEALSRWQKDEARRSYYAQMGSLYLGRPISSLRELCAIPETPLQGSYGWNLCRVVVDTVQARIGKQQLRAVFATEEGNSTYQRRAKGLDRYTRGVAHRSDFHEKLTPLCFRDAQVFGSCVIKGSVSVKPAPKDSEDKPTGKIRIERDRPWQILISESEAAATNPVSWIRVHVYDRQALIDHYRALGKPGAIDAIRTAASASEHDMMDLGAVAGCDQVMVAEGWVVSRGSSQGTYGVAVSSGMLESGPWLEEHPPFAFMNWEEPFSGHWGVSQLEPLATLQAQLDDLCETIVKSTRQNGTVKVIAEEGSNVRIDEIGNDREGVAIYYKMGSTPPQWVVHPSVPPDLFAQVDRIARRFFETSGVSELSAQSQKPAGLNSGVALQNYSDIESARFLIHGQAFETFQLDAYRRIIDLSRQLDSQGVNVEVSSLEKKQGLEVLRRVKWSDVHLDDDVFFMKMKPASALPLTQAGKLQQVATMVESGFLTADEAQELFDMPDTDAILSRKLAPLRLILAQIDWMLEDGKDVTPEPYQNLEQSIVIVQQTLLLETLRQSPEESLQRLRDYLSNAEQLMSMAEAPAAPATPAAAPPGAEQLPPGPPQDIDPASAALAVA
jgi:hypothetical protein